MTISEPTTLLTDYLLAAVVFFLARRLQRSGGKPVPRPLRYWAWAFYASSLAAASGGTVHGFRSLLGDIGALLLWKVTVLSIGLTALFMLSAMAFAVLRGRSRRLLLTLAVVQFLVYLGWMTSHSAFIYVILDYAPALLCVLVLQAFDGWRRRGQSAPWLVSGVLLSFAAAGIQAGGVSLHRHFNHNDLYHVVQLGAFYLLYRGGMLLTVRTDDPGEGR